MRLFSNETHIDFMGQRRLMALTLALFIAVSLGSIFFRGLELGLDFTGGTLIELSAPEPIELGLVREALTEGGFADAVVQHFGSTRDLIVRLSPRSGEQSGELSKQVLSVLQSASRGTIEMRKVEFVGAQVGDELAEQGGLAMLFALIGILIYVALRFEWRLSLGAVLATVHDALFVIGVFSLFRLEFDLNVLASVLAVIGYSLNDTIVVFDRIRENFRRMRSATVVEVMNASINQTLSRTLMTGVTTLLVVVALYFLGGPALHGFSLVLIIGILIGTVSSIYVASPLALWLGVKRENMVSAKKPDEAP
ncbi:MAG: protein translocase subunit SecF [Gammaproteobacteria bacterium]|nr:protein translocase subunit SecF [Gammaproteobacteria bacterium]MCP5417168.1 protein translocase subunit SecF [Chromatiaceae bacterium]